MANSTKEVSRLEKMEAERSRFLETAKEVYPLLVQIRDALTKNGYTESARICVSVDGFMEFAPYGTGWQMNTYSHDPAPKARYEYSEAIPVEEVTV